MRIVVPAALALLASMFGTAQAQNLIEARADSNLMRVMVEPAVTGFQAAEKRRVRFSMLSTISAIEAVSRGQVPLALVLRAGHPYKEDEALVDFTPVAFDALVLITHPGNRVSGLKLRDLREIYAGKLTRWDQVGGSANEINLVAVAGPLDGVEYGLRRALYGAGHRPVAAKRWYLNTEQLEAAIMIDPSGIGVTTLSSLRGKPKLRALAIEGVAPSTTTMRSGEYLLVTPVYVAHRRDTIPFDTTMRFVRYLGSTQAAEWMRQRNLLPLRESQQLAAAFHTREQRLLELLKQPAAAPPEVTTPAAGATAPGADPSTSTSQPPNGDGSP